MKAWIKRFVILMGSWIPLLIYRKAELLLNYLSVGRWMRLHGFVPRAWLRTGIR